MKNEFFVNFLFYRKKTFWKAVFWEQLRLLCFLWKTCFFLQFRRKWLNPQKIWVNDMKKPWNFKLKRWLVELDVNFFVPEVSKNSSSFRDLITEFLRHHKTHTYLYNSLTSMSTNLHEASRCAYISSFIVPLGFFFEKPTVGWIIFFFIFWKMGGK